MEEYFLEGADSRKLVSIYTLIFLPYHSENLRFQFTSE